MQELRSESVFGTVLLALGAAGIGTGLAYGGYLVFLTVSSPSSTSAAGSPWMGPVFVLLVGIVFVGLSTLFWYEI